MKLEKSNILNQKIYDQFLNNYPRKMKPFNLAKNYLMKANNFNTENNNYVFYNDSSTTQKSSNNKYKISYSNCLLKNPNNINSDQYSVFVTDSALDSKKNNSIGNIREISIYTNKISNYSKNNHNHNATNNNFYNKKFREIFATNNSNCSKSKIYNNLNFHYINDSGLVNKSFNNIFNNKITDSKNKNIIRKNYGDFINSCFTENYNKERKGKVVSLVDNTIEYSKNYSNLSGNKIKTSHSNKYTKLFNNYKIKNNSIRKNKKQTIPYSNGKTKHSKNKTCDLSISKKSLSHSHFAGIIADSFINNSNNYIYNLKPCKKNLTKNLLNSAYKTNNAVKSTSYIKYKPIIYKTNKNQKEESKAVINFYDKKINLKHNENNNNSINNNLIEHYNYSKYINNGSNYNENKLKDVNENQLFDAIKNLWNKIGGVNQNYQETFMKLSKNLKPVNKKEFFIEEINNLSLLLEKIENLNNKIKNRSEVILKIKGLNKKESQIANVIQLLLSLRKITIEIVNEYINFKQNISYDVLNNKFNESNIKNYNKDFLKAISEDINFLFSHEYLNKLFKFSESNDPFLLTPSDATVIKNTTYNLLPISENILKEIHKCERFLLKEKINANLQLNKNNETLNVNNTNNYIITSNSFNFPKSCNSNYNYNKDNDETNTKINTDTNKISKTYNLNNITPGNMKSISYENEIIINDTLLSSDDIKVTVFDPKKDRPIKELYKNYLNTVNNKIKLSFNINENIDYYINIGIYPKIILFKDTNNHIYGMCTISYSKEINLNSKILTITSISCSNMYKISQIFTNLLEFLKNNEITYDELVIFLYFMKNTENGRFYLDDELQNEIKNKSKFKWQSLENDGEHRKIKYHYVPNNIIINKENSIQNDEIEKKNSFINMNSYCMIKYNENVGLNNMTIEEHSKLYFVFNIIYNYLITEKNKNELSEKYLSNFKGLKLKKITRLLSEYNNILISNSQNFKDDYNKNENYKQELFKKFTEIIDNNNYNNNIPLAFNFCNIYSNFSSIVKAKINNYEYNIISMDDLEIEAFKISDNNENDFIYFTKSENEKISFIFYEIENADLGIKNHYNLVLQKILMKDSEEPAKSFKKIAVPTFSCKNKLEGNIGDSFMKCDMIDSEEKLDFCLENNINKEVKFSFPLADMENDNNIKVLKKDFIMAVINQDLILDYSIPAMSIYYISKNLWMKADNQ